MIKSVDPFTFCNINTICKGNREKDMKQILSLYKAPFVIIINVLIMRYFIDKHVNFLYFQILIQKTLI
jgi:hypothetical protein